MTASSTYRFFLDSSAANAARLVGFPVYLQRVLEIAALIETIAEVSESRTPFPNTLLKHLND